MTIITTKRALGDNADPATIRKIILFIFLAGVCGSATELLLINHTENIWQIVPLALLSISLISLVLIAFFRRAVAIRLFQMIMILFIIGGGAGMYLHYQDKVEFKLELNPDLKGIALFREAIKGSSVPPVLAPGIMIQLGLLGLAYTFRHPYVGNSIKR